MERRFERMEDLATNINSDIRSIRKLLSDMKEEMDTDTLHSMDIIAEHLHGLGQELSVLAYEADDAAYRRKDWQ